MKKTIISIAILAFFFIAAVGSGSSSSTTTTNNGHSWDVYSIPVNPRSGACSACGSRGYTIRNGVKEICFPCGGTGKAVSFPEPK